MVVQRVAGNSSEPWAMLTSVVTTGGRHGIRRFIPKVMGDIRVPGIKLFNLKWLSRQGIPESSTWPYPQHAASLKVPLSHAPSMMVVAYYVAAWKISKWARASSYGDPQTHFSHSDATVPQRDMFPALSKCPLDGLRAWPEHTPPPTHLLPCPCPTIVLVIDGSVKRGTGVHSCMYFGLNDRNPKVTFQRGFWTHCLLKARTSGRPEVSVVA